MLLVRESFLAPSRTMVRIFPSLAISALMVLSGTAVLGLMVDDRHLYAEHFSLSLFGVIITLLIHVVVFTYFTVTGKMIGQAVMIGHLDREPLQRVRRYKLRITRCLVLSFATIVVVVAFGALADRDRAWHLWHLVSAAVMLCVNAGAFYVEYGLMVLNGRMTTAVIEEYNAVKTDQAMR